MGIKLMADKNINCHEYIKLKLAESENNSTLKHELF